MDVAGRRGLVLVAHIVDVEDVSTLEGCRTVADWWGLYSFGPAAGPKETCTQCTEHALVDVDVYTLQCRNVERLVTKWTRIGIQKSINQGQEVQRGS